MIWMFLKPFFKAESMTGACLLHTKSPPRIHDLVRMAKMAEIEFDEDTLEFMDAVNTFNISTRYPDEKLKFYKTCTHEFTEEHFQRIKGIYKCLLQKIKP